MVRVFVNSTWEDLRPERQAVEDALDRLGETYVGMENFGSRPETTREVSLAEVDRSDIYVGIFAHRYGSGITEAEYRRAIERKMPILAYIKAESVPVIPAYNRETDEGRRKLDALVDELKSETHRIHLHKRGQSCNTCPRTPEPPRYPGRFTSDRLARHSYGRRRT